MDKIYEWAQKWVPRFNEKSELFNTGYYTQSPLNVIEESPDLMIIGINPKGTFGNGESIKTVEEFLNGNPCWNDRFDAAGNITWGSYIGNTHHFFGLNNKVKVVPFDDDKKTVWTNLSPFDSENGSNDLPRELLQIGIESTLELINHIKPKKIVLLSLEAFSKLDRFNLDKKQYPIEHEKVLPKWGLEVGRICGIPTISIVHPSSSAWPISNKFTSVFVFLHGMVDIPKNGKIQKLSEVLRLMRQEYQLWNDRMM